MQDTLDIPRVQRLRDATQTLHQRLDSAIMAADPFGSTANYGRFAAVQYLFHRDVAPLYDRPELAALIPDLAGLGRFEAVGQDLADLGQPLPLEPAPPAGLALPHAEALGWLYVVEGSNLGAAFLFKAALKLGLSAEHGARHLAGAPEGRAAHWRAFTTALNAARLTPEEDAAAEAGANAAFARVRGLVAAHLGQL